MVAEDGGDGWSEGRNSFPRISRPTLSSLLNGKADLSEAGNLSSAAGVQDDLRGRGIKSAAYVRMQVP
jgi:hypothetical protein